MRLSELTESPKTFTKSDFPLVLNNVSDNYGKVFETALTKLNTAIKDGELTATEFKSIKDGLNRPLELSYEKVIREKYYHGGKWESIPKELDVIYDLRPELHRAASALKKLEKIKSKEPLHKDALEFFTQINSIVLAVQSLKDKIVKKKRAAVEKETAASEKTATIMSHKDVKKVKKVLTEVTKQLHDDVLAGNVSWLNNIVAQYKKQYDKNDRQTGYLRKYARDPFTRSIVGKVVERDGFRVDDAETIKKDYKEILKKEATKMTDDTLAVFISKNTSKMAEILKNKNNLKTIKLNSADASRGVVEGILDLVFSDKSSFTVKNKIVTSYSKHGKPFYRFPTTFHKVVTADGSSMKTPSEKKMKEQF